MASDRVSSNGRQLLTCIYFFVFIINCIYVKYDFYSFEFKRWLGGWLVGRLVGRLLWLLLGIYKEVAQQISGQLENIFIKPQNPSTD